MRPSLRGATVRLLAGIIIYKGSPILELWTARTRNLGEPQAFERPLKGLFKRGLEGI